MRIVGIVLAGIVVGAALMILADQVQQSRAETVGQKVDTAVGRAKEGARDMADWLRQQFEEARVSVDRMSTHARVYARLHWDKALNGATIYVEVQANGVTSLRGTVPSEAAKTKAAQLAQDTVGVESVVDDLKVAAAPSAR